MKKNIFKNKKVLITGHTGFKGSWLTLWMLKLGAKVLGISKDIPSSPSHFELIGIKKKIINRKINIQDFIKVRKIIQTYKPDFIFHLAAQAIVKESYKHPNETWKTNLNGTINILESLKGINKKTIVILVTSDKVYKNLEVTRGYKENDLLGGIDPYGASKAATEIAIKSFIKSFFNNKNNKVRISIARAGNVIGGGDWSRYRLIPDCIRAWLSGKKVIIRNPKSTRPWQHVLEVLSGYITLANFLHKSKKFHGEAFNFGPNSKNYKVIEILNTIKKVWPEIKWQTNQKKIFFENSLLNLNSTKSKKFLNWKCKLNFFQTIFLTIEWYLNFKKNKKNQNANFRNSLNQINFYEKK